MAGPESHQDLASRLRELGVVNDLIRTLTSTLELPEILSAVLDRMKTLTRAEALSLLLYDGERDELVFAASETLRENAVAGLRIPLESSIAGWVAGTGKSTLVEDVAKDPRFYAAIDEISRFSTRSLLAVPLIRDGRTIGVIELANRYGGSRFEESDRSAMERLARDVAPTIDPGRVAKDPDAMRALLARIVEAVPSEAASLLLYDLDGRELVFRASRTLQPGIIDGLRIRADQGIAGWVARNRVSLRLDDVTRDPRYYAGVAERTRLTPRSMICVPMVSKGRLLGVIQVINKIGGASFDENELRLTQTLADHAAIAIENASLYQQAYRASITDDLTGLGNTRHFNRMLPELVARGGPVSLLVLDLDNFKEVVDAFGHLAGSRTIGEIGRMIGRHVRPGDVAARFGGDEFVIVLPETDSAAARTIAEAIRAAIEDARSIPGESVDISRVTASIGVATYPDGAADAESLFRAADAAMYAVKRSGKNSVGLSPGSATSPTSSAGVERS